MKKLISLLIPTLMSNLFAQPTITQAQFALSIGDMITSYPQTYSAPSEGPSQIWDFTGLDVSSPTTVTVIDGNSSSIAGLPPSTLCTVSNQEDCFLIDAAGMQRTGIGGSGISVPYQDNESIFQFPITYGDNLVDTYHSNYMIGSFPAHRRGTTTIDVVGYGTLMLPASVTINNAMLVKTHEVQTDSVNPGTWNVTNFDMTTYYFYAAGYHGYVLLMVSGTASPGGPVSFGNYNVLQSGAGVKNEQINNSFSIYPNPVKDLLFINYEGHHSLVGSEYKIVNALGAVMETGIVTNEKLSFNVNEYPSGIYVLNINGTNFELSKRFIKQ